MAKTLVAFIPVIHKGYLDLLKKYPERVLIFSQEIINSYGSLLRDVRVVPPAEIKKIIECLGLAKNVGVAGLAEFKKMAKSKEGIVMVDDDVSRDIAAKCLMGNEVYFEKVFLRWDKLMTLAENVVSPDRKISQNPKDRKFLAAASEESQKSADWWRQIGAVAVKNGKVLFQGYNRHLPADFHLSAFGDPRVNFDKGERPDIYTSIHSEALIVAEAAKKGTSLRGASFYVTTFPCSNCARLIAEAGVKKVFYSKGYSRLDAEKILDAYEVEIILVQ